MAVTSETFLTVPVFRFSGVVTDAEIQAAWGSLITNGVYVINRAIYLDNTADLTGVNGGFLVDTGTQVTPGIILHTSRDKTKSTFNNFTFLQAKGITVINRSKYVQTTNGTTLVDAGGGLSADGVSLKGGGFIYAPVGNNGPGDGRFLNEMAFTGFEGATLYSQQFTEQELQPCVGASTTLKGVAFEKCFGFPQVGTPSGNVNVVVYRSTQNTESTTAYPLRSFPAGNRWGSLCYVDSYVTRSGVDITFRLLDSFGANANNRVVVMILNNFTRESWFGASKTSFTTMGNWHISNEMWGGVLKKLQFINGDGGVVKAYDSRSTAVSQKSSFQETGTVDFLNASVTPTTDVDGKISLVHIGASSTGAGPNPAIVRYNSQKYTFQKFGFRVIVGIPDMTSGDNDLSAFSPVILTVQNGITRTQAQIQAATTISLFTEVVEELHNLAIVSSGITSYGADYGGNFFSLDGKTLSTSFDSVVIDPLATSKIAYNQATNTLTLKSAEISSNSIVSEWRNLGGTFDFQNDSKISGVFADDDGSRVAVSGLDPEDFGVTWNVRYKKAVDSTWIELSGTGNVTTILADLAEYNLQARVAGYTWKNITFDTNETLGIELALAFHETANGTPQYLESFNASLEGIFEYNDAEMSVEVTNTTGAILQPGFNELYRVVERVQQLPALVWTWVNPVTVNATSQKVLIPPTSPLTLFLSDDSDASVKITCPVVYLDTGISADDKVKGNASGFSIILGSSATADSSLIVSQLIDQLGGSGFNTETHSLTKIKGKVDKSLTKNQYLGLK